MWNGLMVCQHRLNDEITQVRPLFPQLAFEIQLNLLSLYNSYGVANLTGTVKSV